MKHLIPAFLLLAVRVAAAQAVTPTLDRDPVFSTVLTRRMAYPVEAERLGVYAKIYAGFRISRNGHVQDVHILNPARIGYGFEEEVAKRLKRLPPLHTRYEGTYALPVTFAFVDYTNGAKAVSPAGTLLPWYIANRTLLPEIQIISRNNTGRQSRYAPLTVGQVLTTDP